MCRHARTMHAPCKHHACTIHASTSITHHARTQASFARGGLLLADYINAMSTAMCAVKVSPSVGRLRQQVCQLKHGITRHTERDATPSHPRRRGTGYTWYDAHGPVAHLGARTDAWCTCGQGARLPDGGNGSARRGTATANHPQGGRRVQVSERASE